MQDTDSIYECERLQERITRLASGVAVTVGSGKSIVIDVLQLGGR